MASAGEVQTVLDLVSEAEWRGFSCALVRDGVRHDVRSPKGVPLSVADVRRILGVARSDVWLLLRRPAAKGAWNAPKAVRLDVADWPDGPSMIADWSADPDVESVVHVAGYGRARRVPGWRGSSLLQADNTCRQLSRP